MAFASLCEYSDKLGNFQPIFFLHAAGIARYDDITPPLQSNCLKILTALQKLTGIELDMQHYRPKDLDMIVSTAFFHKNIDRNRRDRRSCC